MSGFNPNFPSTCFYMRALERPLSCERPIYTLPTFWKTGIPVSTAYRSPMKVDPPPCKPEPENDANDTESDDDEEGKEEPWQPEPEDDDGGPAVLFLEMKYPLSVNEIQSLFAINSPELVVPYMRPCDVEFRTDPEYLARGSRWTPLLCEDRAGFPDAPDHQALAADCCLRRLAATKAAQDATKAAKKPAAVKAIEIKEKPIAKKAAKAPAARAAEGGNATTTTPDEATVLGVLSVPATVKGLCGKLSFPGQAYLTGPMNSLLYTLFKDGKVRKLSGFKSGVGDGKGLPLWEAC